MVGSRVGQAIKYGGNSFGRFHTADRKLRVREIPSVVPQNYVIVWKTLDTRSFRRTWLFNGRNIR